MNYKTQHIPKGTQNNRRPGIKMQAEYLTIHSTANAKSSAQNERDWLVNTSNTRTASWHIAVDENGAIEAIPLDEVAWHAGDGGKGTGNRKSIGIEICESGDRAKTIQNATELVAKMLHERGWNIDNLKRHYDWSGKNCPRILSANNWEGWNAFKIIVGRELKKLDEKKLDTIKIKLHGKEMQTEGIFKDNINYIPVRFLEQLGYEIGWDNDTDTILIDYKGEDE